jgi:hypothetical protein
MPQPTPHLDRHRRRAALVIAERLAGRQADPPIVQRTGDRPAMDDALRQAAVLVRTAVEQREDLALRRAEDGDVVAALDLHRAAAANGDLVDPADVEPFCGRRHAISFWGVNRAIGA